MHLSPNYNNYSTPKFTGKVDKSVKKYIEKSYKHYYESNAKIAERYEIKLDETALKNTKIRIDKSLKKLEEYMKQFHPKTVLKLEMNPESTMSKGYFFSLCNDSVSKKMFVENNYAKKTSEIYDKNKINILDPIYGHNQNIYEHPYRNIEMFSEFTDKITSSVTPQTVDKAFLDMKANDVVKDASDLSLLGIVKTKYNTFKTEKFAKEINADESWLHNFKTKIQTALNSNIMNDVVDVISLK